MRHPMQGAMRQRIYTSLEEGIVYRDVETPEPPQYHRAAPPVVVRPTRDKYKVYLALFVVLLPIFLRVLATLLSWDVSSPCSTPAHALANARLRFLARVLPMVVSVRGDTLWRPVILAKEGKLQSREHAPGCEKSAVRASKVVVSSKTGAWFGRRKNSTYTGITAACIQHALDFAAGAPC